MKYRFTCIFSLVMVLACTGCLHFTGYSTGQRVSVLPMEMIPDTITDNWEFVAQQAMPQVGRSRNVTGGYTVRYSPGKLVVALPYYGRAYAGAGYGIQNALDFITTNFSYTEEPGKKNRRTITIKPKDYSEVQSLSFTFYPSGTARLSVILTNRSPISFSGVVEITN